MIIDDSKFPIVFVDFQHSLEQVKDETNNHNSDMAAFTSLFEKEKPFVMISTGETPDEKHKHSREETRKINAWRKINKDKLKCIKATIQVEPSKVKRVGLTLFASVYEKFWGNPLLLAQTQEEALELAKDVLHKASLTS
jgi:agmatine/peptidylarginine deiminase